MKALGIILIGAALILVPTRFVTDASAVSCQTVPVENGCVGNEGGPPDPGTGRPETVRSDAPTTPSGGDTDDTPRAD